jgi:hypothetical protein
MNNTVPNSLSCEADRSLASKQFTLFNGKINVHDRNIQKSYKFSYTILTEITIICNCHEVTVTQLTKFVRFPLF